MSDREDRGVDQPEMTEITVSDLRALEQQASQLARLRPKYDGTRAALRLLRSEVKRKEVEVARAQREAASYRLKIAQAELVLCEAASRRGDPNIPTTIEERPFRHWLDEERDDIEEEA